MRGDGAVADRDATFLVISAHDRKQLGDTQGKRLQRERQTPGLDIDRVKSARQTPSLRQGLVNELGDVLF